MTRRRSSAAVGLAALVGLVACGGSSSSTESGGVDPERRGPQGRVAQFVVECDASHIAYDDPIVYPDEPGASHLHQFFGNRSVDSNPDYDRVAGADTSCDQRLDTASYWAPALLDSEGRRVEPLGLVAYYRPGDGVDPGAVEPYPAGLMLIGGDAASAGPQDTSVVAWSCGTGALRATEPTRCPPTSTLRMIVAFPDCWDGERLTGRGSSAHAVYSDDGCPQSHPVAVPRLVIAVDYPSVDPAGLSLASGPVHTAHADFWNVWDQDKLEREVTACLNRDLVCGISG